MSNSTLMDQKNNKIYFYNREGEILKENIYPNLKINFLGHSSCVEMYYSSNVIRGEIKIRDNSHIILKEQLKIMNKIDINIAGEHCCCIIGKNTIIGSLAVQIDEPNLSVTIGDDNLIGFGVNMRTGDGHTIYDLVSKQPLNIPKDINIGNHCWIGRDVVFLKGASIADNCVVGMKALVTKKFDQQNCILVGIPAKIIKTNINWDVKTNYQYMAGKH